MKIAFLGDSITEGCFELITGDQGNVEGIIDRDHAYDTVLLKKIKSNITGIDVIGKNFGVSGDSSEEGLKRVAEVLAWNPDAVVVCFGLNDVCSREKEAYAFNLNQIFEKIKQNGARIIFMTPNMLNTYVDEKTISNFIGYAHETAIKQNDGSMDAYMELAKETARLAGAIVCDVYSVWKKLSFYGIDTTLLLSNHINHPTRKMHCLFADMLFDICKEYLFENGQK